MGAEIGMLVVETIAKIRRAYFVHGQPIKAICRDLGVSRKVVRKVIRSEATEFRYEREAQPLPRIGPWSEKLDQLLSANEGKASRERLTLIRLDECIRQFMQLPEAQRHLYEIHTAPQSDLVGATLSTDHIVELARLRDFLGK